VRKPSFVANDPGTLYALKYSRSCGTWRRWFRWHGRQRQPFPSLGAGNL